MKTNAEQKVAGYSTKYRFTGKEVDEETGLYYFGARYAACPVCTAFGNPRISLWYVVDPMTSLFPNISPYLYAYNNPVRFIDRQGLYGEESDATKAQELAVKKYGADRVGDVYFNKDKNEYAFQIYGEGKDKYTHSSNDGVMAYKPDVSVYNNDQYSNYGSSTIGKVDNLGEKIDPSIGLSSWSLSRGINKELQYHSYTLDEGFERSLKRVNPVKTPFGSMKATTAFKTANVLGKVGLGLNIISAANYGNEIINGNAAKGWTGLGVMALTTGVAIVCPPCALATIGTSALYSLYLEDKIFEENKNKP